MHDGFWYEREDSEEASAEVMSVAAQMRSDQSDRLARCLYNLSIYEGRRVHGSQLEQYAENISDELVGDWDPDQMRANHARNAVHAIQAKIAGRSRPLPMFLTSGADFTQKHRAKNLGKFTEGLLHQRQGPYANVWELAQDVVLDALVTEMGVVRAYADQDLERVCYERVHSWELFVDRRESYYGNPRTLVHSQYWDAARLAAVYPEHKDAINLAAMTKPVSQAGMGTADAQFLSRQVLVNCAWHLRSGPNEDDGRYVVAIEGQCLEDTEYTRDYFPFAFLRFNRERQGFFATPYISDIERIQTELDLQMSSVSREAQISTSRIWAEDDSIESSDLDDVEGGICFFKMGTRPPEQVQANAISREKLDYIDRLKNELYSVGGVSQDRATSMQSRADLSGVAKRIDNDLETERFSVIARGYELLFVELAKQGIDCVREIAEEKPNFHVTWPGKGFLETVKWADVSLEEDQYYGTVTSANSLPKDASGRFATIQEWIAAGWVTTSQGMQLMESPDIEQFQNYELSQEHLMEKIIERMETYDPEDDDDFEYIGPDTYMRDLPGALRMMVHARLNALVSDASTHVVLMMSRWIDEARLLIEPPQPAAPPGAMPGQPGPPGPMAAAPPPSGPLAPTAAMPTPAAAIGAAA